MIQKRLRELIEEANKLDQIFHEHLFAETRDYLMKYARTLRDTYPALHDDEIESLMVNCSDRIYSTTLYNMWSSAFNKLSDEDFWARSDE